MPDDLMGVQEIAKLLGVTRQRVDRITRTHEDFPAPIAELASGRVWKRTHVESWARQTGRLPADEKGRGQGRR